MGVHEPILRMAFLPFDSYPQQDSESIREKGIASLEEIREKEIDSVHRYRDLLEMAQLVSWCTDRDYLIRSCLEHIHHRLGMRARCALMEKGELIIQCWVGQYEFPVLPVAVSKESVVWKAINNGEPVNLTEWPEREGYRHTLLEEVKIKSIIPLWNVDFLSQEEKIAGALIVDSGKEGTPVSADDFAYLKEVGQLIGAAVGKAELMTQLVECHRGKKNMVTETLDAFRNRITAIGMICRRIKKMVADQTDLVQEARDLMEEVELLENHLQRFERYMEQ
jgi:GAF domain-containing protein